MSAGSGLALTGVWACSLRASACVKEQHEGTAQHCLQRLSHDTETTEILHETRPVVFLD